MKLPNVFANPIDRKIDNNSSYYHTRQQGEKKDISSLKTYFDSNGYTNRLPVLLKTKQGTVKDKLILYKDNAVITIHNEKINISDILDYEIVK